MEKRLERHFEIIDAFVDGERVDAAALKAALADEAGRDYLVDLWLLRESVQEEMRTDSPVVLSPPSVPRAVTSTTNARPWLAAAAIALVSVAAGYFAGSRAITEPSTPPAPPTPTVAAAPAPAERAFSASAPTRVIPIEFTPDLSPSRAGAGRATPRKTSGLGIVPPIGTSVGGAGTLSADLWLLHRFPSGTEQVQHQVAKVGTFGGDFSFEPVMFTTSRGDVRVELAGSFERYNAPVNGELVLLKFGRVVNGRAAPAEGLAGDWASLLPLPTRLEVLSFDMSTGSAASRAGGSGQPVARLGAGGGGVARVQTGGGGGARAGGGGGRGGFVSAGASQLNPAAAARSAQIAQMFEGHSFAIRVRLTPN